MRHSSRRTQVLGVGCYDRFDQRAHSRRGAQVEFLRPARSGQPAELRQRLGHDGRRLAVCELGHKSDGQCCRDSVVRDVRHPRVRRNKVLGVRSTYVSSSLKRCYTFSSSTNGLLGQPSVNTTGIAAGQMGDALPFIQLGAQQIASALAVGSDHACAILTNGVKCWGCAFKNKYIKQRQREVTPLEASTSTDNSAWETRSTAGTQSAIWAMLCHLWTSVRGRRHRQLWP